MKNKDKMPKGVSYIIGNELAERFSYYGMKTILTIFMTKYLMDAAGQPDYMTNDESKVWYHMFLTANYFFPILGALLSDILWGKYRTIIVLSIVYCAGHLALALDETRLGLSLGLTLIAIGAGGIKPCVSAHVGDQFNRSNSHLLEKVYNMFYLSINVGSIFSILLTPYLLREYGPHVAFGIPGILMMVATIVFWMGRNKYSTVPPAGFKKYIESFKNPEVIKSLNAIGVIYLFIAIFWSLYEQTGSAWVIQADSKYMSKHVELGFISFDMFPDQLQFLNALFVIIFVPFFSYFLYPKISNFFPLTPLRKISIGMFFAAISFIVIALAEEKIQQHVEISIMWQVVAYIILTASEVLIYGTGLEFSYSQAPHNMKSLIMGMYMLSISLGNFITALINYVIQNPDGTSKLVGANYYWFFVGLMLFTAIGFIFIARNYRMRIYLQDQV